MDEAPGSQRAWSDSVIIKAAGVVRQAARPTSHPLRQQYWSSYVQCDLRAQLALVLVNHCICMDFLLVSSYPRTH